MSEISKLGYYMKDYLEIIQRYGETATCCRGFFNGGYDIIPKMGVYPSVSSVIILLGDHFTNNETPIIDYDQDVKHIIKAKKYNKNYIAADLEALQEIIENHKHTTKCCIMNAVAKKLAEKINNEEKDIILILKMMISKDLINPKTYTKILFELLKSERRVYYNDVIQTVADKSADMSSEWFYYEKFQLQSNTFPIKELEVIRDKLIKVNKNGCVDFKVCFDETAPPGVFVVEITKLVFDTDVCVMFTQGITRGRTYRDSFYGTEEELAPYSCPNGDHKGTNFSVEYVIDTLRRVLHNPYCTILVQRLPVYREGVICQCYKESLGSKTIDKVKIKYGIQKRKGDTLCQLSAGVIKKSKQMDDTTLFCIDRIYDMDLTEVKIC